RGRRCRSTSATSSSSRRRPVDGAVGRDYRRGEEGRRSEMELPSLFRWNRPSRALPHRGENPFLAFQREMNHLLEDFWSGSIGESTQVSEWSAFSPRIDVEDTEAEVRVTAELPGLEEKDFQVEVHDDVLTLRGEKHEEREDKAKGWRERSYGTFQRAVALPAEVESDRATAEFKKGVLTVHLPKSAKAQERSRRVPVTAA